MLCLYFEARVHIGFYKCVVSLSVLTVTSVCDAIFLWHKEGQKYAVLS